MRILISVVSLTVALLSGCSGAKRHAPVVDPFDNGNPQYQGVRPLIEEVRDKACSSATPIALSASEATSVNAATASLRKLAEDGHVPSIFLWADYSNCQLNPLLDSCLNGKPASRDISWRAEEAGVSVASYCDQLLKVSEKILSEFNYAAEYGYPPAQRKLASLAKPIPLVFRRTNEQLKIELMAEIERRESQARRQALSSAIADAFAKAGEALVESNSGRMHRRNPDSLPEAQTYRGCIVDTECSYPARCVRASTSLEGICATPVDGSGLPTLDLGEVRGMECSFDVDCSVGFRCLKRSGALEGICVQ